MATATLKHWTEHVTAPHERIDREEGVIYGVKVLGLSSRNRREYLAEAVQKAIPKYEGAKVYIDHPPKGKPVKDRPRAEHWGVLRGVRESEGGLYADLHYIKSHPMTEQILEAAERFPDTFGLSHNAEGSEERINGKNVVTSIESVNSVDIVSDPATNSSLFESTKMKRTVKQILERHAKDPKSAILLEMTAGETLVEMGDDYMPEELEVEMPEDDMEPSVDGDVNAAFRSIFMSILDNDQYDMATKLSKLRILLKAKETVQQAVETDNTDSVETEESDEVESDEMMSESVKKMADENAKLKAELDAIKTRSLCESMLRDANREVTDVRVKALVSLQESDRKTFIDELPAAVKQANQTNKVRPAASPSKVFQESASTGYPKSKDDFKKALHS